MVNKRKRDEFSDLDEITPGKQNLPVANLPHNFDGEPQDGTEYLFLVRRDARRLPHVTRVRNPYEVSEVRMDMSIPSPPNVLPCEEWRNVFQNHFSNLRKNLTQITIHIDDGQSGSRQKAIPEKKDRNAWWKFLAGHPESAWNPSAQSVRNKSSNSCRRVSVGPAKSVHPGDATSLLGIQSRDESSLLTIHCFDDSPRSDQRRPGPLDLLRSMGSTNQMPSAMDPLASSGKAEEEHNPEHLLPPEVTPSHLRDIDHRMSIHLLMYFTHWINVHLQNPGDPLTTISVTHGRWIFALLTKVEDQLSADEMNLLRNLSRACLGLIQKYRGDQVTSNTEFQNEEASSPALIEGTMRMSDVSCWMVFAAVAGHWGQRDLWTDAAAALAGA